MTPFFITGLPRSRTAWLANLFTTDTTLCLHEPRAFGPVPGYRVGVSDSTLPLKYPALNIQYPNAPWLFVERDEADAMRSFIRFTRKHICLLRRDVQRFWDMHREASQKMFSNPMVLKVHFDKLHDEEVMRLAWSHLLPDVPWQHERWKMVESLKIEQNIATRIKEVLWA